MQELVQLFVFLAEALRCHVHHFECLRVPVELASAKNSSKFLHSEVNLLIQHTVLKVVQYIAHSRTQMYNHIVIESLPEFHEINMLSESELCYVVIAVAAKIFFYCFLFLSIREFFAVLFYQHIVLLPLFRTIQ